MVKKTVSSIILYQLKRWKMTLLKESSLSILNSQGITMVQGESFQLQDVISTAI